MNSPVNHIIKQLVTFDKSQVQPVYIQVSQQVINAIQRGYLHKGSKLPGTRVFSALLNVHRNTAVAIYDELASQGWVDIIANKGTLEDVYASFMGCDVALIVAVEASGTNTKVPLLAIISTQPWEANSS